MGNEIKVGDWIRDREGHITKIIETLSLFKDVELYLGEDGYQYSDNAIVKHSSNLIDLIQCGDYVNGYKVLYVCNEEPCPSGKYVDIDCDKSSEESYFFDNQIETIVTKEQFESISYKVGKE